MLAAGLNAVSGILRVVGAEVAESESGTGSHLRIAKAVGDGLSPDPATFSMHPRKLTSLSQIRTTR